MGGLAKGLAVIRAFSRDHAALSLSEIARSARIPAATARRCLLTLEELGYITRSGRDFLLRPKVLELGAAYLESMNIEQLTKKRCGSARVPRHVTHGLPTLRNAPILAGKGTEDDRAREQ